MQCYHYDYYYYYVVECKTGISRTADSRIKMNDCRVEQPPNLDLGLQSRQPLIQIENYRARIERKLLQRGCVTEILFRRIVQYIRPLLVFHHHSPWSVQRIITQHYICRNLERRPFFVHKPTKHEKFQMPIIIRVFNYTRHIIVLPASFPLNKLTVLLTLISMSIYGLDECVLSHLFRINHVK